MRYKWGALRGLKIEKRCLTSSLLDGKIFEEFQRLSKLYLSPPSGKLNCTEIATDRVLRCHLLLYCTLTCSNRMYSVLLRPWSTLHERTSILMRTFSQNGIDSRDRFLEMIKSEKRIEIANSIKHWIPQSNADMVDEIFEFQRKGSGVLNWLTN